MERVDMDKMSQEERDLMMEQSKLLFKLNHTEPMTEEYVSILNELLDGNIGENTVVQTVTSPSGKYYAQLTDNDQGALGGATIVKVHEVSGIDTFLFKAEKKPREVYHGHWGEFMDMQIYWKDDECLVINSVEYTLN